MMTPNNTESESPDVKPTAIAGSNFSWHIDSGCFKGKEPGAYALSRTFNRCNRKWQLRLELQAPDQPPQLSLEIVSLPIRWSFRAYISYGTVRYISGRTSSYECEHNFLNNNVAGEEKKSCVLGPLHGEFDLIACKFDLRYLQTESKRKKSLVSSSSQPVSKKPRKDSSSCDNSSLGSACSRSSTPSYTTFARKLGTTADSSEDESSDSANRSVENESEGDSGSSEEEGEELGTPVTSSDDDDSSGEKSNSEFYANVGAHSPILSGSHLITTWESDGSAAASSVQSTMKRKSLTQNSSSPKMGPPVPKVCSEVKPNGKLATKLLALAREESKAKDSKIAKLTIKTEEPKDNCSHALNLSSSSTRSVTVKPEVKIEMKPDIKLNIRAADTRLTLDLECLINDEKFSDLIIVTQTRRRFHAHKAILSARSGKFSEMIQQNERETKKVMGLYDISDDLLEQLLRFIYTGTVSDIDYNTLELFKAADKFKIQGLKDMCVERLANYLSVDNASEILIISNKNHYLSLKAQALAYINRNAVEIIDTEGFQKMTESDPTLVTELYCLLVRDTNNTHKQKLSKNQTM